MKRLAVIALPILAFIAGGAAIAGWQGWQRSRAAVIAAHAPVGTSASATAATTAPANAADSDQSNLLPDGHWPQDAPTPEQVMYAQPELLERAIARLKPRTPGRVNMYAIMFAGDGSENVFRNEAEYFDELLTQRLGAAGHVLVLENNPATLTTQPLATWSNLEDALDAVASRMNLRQDVLLVYLTTHGSEDHTLLVDMDPLPLDQIGVNDLAGILAEHPFKYKVVIVNACYSGGFIPSLRGPGTMIITAARADRSSFGCGEQSALTWFGHAFVVNALNRTDNFQQAFVMAKEQVSTWEQRDGYAASDPQIAIGSGIAAQLAAWRGGVRPGPPVPFAPPALPAHAASTGNAQ